MAAHKGQETMVRNVRWPDWALCALLALVLGACARTPPEQALRQRMDALQQAIEARDAAAIDKLLRHDFIGNDGMDKRQARRMAAALFIRYRNVGVNIGPLQVRLHGESQATVEFTAAATGGDGALPDNGQIWNVTTGWRLAGGDWMLLSAEWKPKL